MADRAADGVAVQPDGDGVPAGQAGSDTAGPVVDADAQGAEESPVSGLKQLLERATHEAARANADYDVARDDLATHHGEMDKRAQSLVKQIEALEPEVETILAGNGEGLDRSSALDLLKYADLHGELRKVRMARRMAWPATQPAGEYAVGKEIG